MSSILVTIPDQVASAFIDHLAKLHPRIANQITIRVLDDSTARSIMEEPPVIEFPVHIPEDYDHYGVDYRP